MYISTDCIQNIVPKIYTRVYVNICAKGGKCIAHTNCRKVNDSFPFAVKTHSIWLKTGDK
jgi:hypothetical protein